MLLRINYLLLFALLAFGIALSIVTGHAQAALPYFPESQNLEDLSLTINIAGEGQVEVDPTLPTYVYNQEVQLVATPDPGWRFYQWEGTLDAVEWWDTRWRYRVPIVVGADAVERTAKPVELAVDFTALLAGLNQSASFDPATIRVVEIDSSEQIIDASVPFQFDPSPGFDPDTNATGTLIILVEGLRSGGTARTYHVYFETADRNLPPLAVTPLVALSDDVLDEGWSSYRIVTEGATYFYHKDGGGFSSLLDSASFDSQDARDWINWNRALGDSGDFRGIPNLIRPADGGFFHPGRCGGSSIAAEECTADSAMDTEVLSNGPLRVAFASTTPDGKWRVRWDIYPGYATATIEQIDLSKRYWFLYEGTPAGVLDAGDAVGRWHDVAPGYWITAYDSPWCNDVHSAIVTEETCPSSLRGPDWSTEWAFVSDTVRAKSLFIVHHQDDTAVDSYRKLGSMTVLGFGRNGNSPLLNGEGRKFTLGFVDSTDPAQVKQAIDSAYLPLAAELGIPEEFDTNSEGSVSQTNPLIIYMTTPRVVTAVFVPAYYQIHVETFGDGQINVTPPADRAGYSYGESVTATAVANEGWRFNRWTGSVTGTANPVTFSVVGDETINGSFARFYYSLDIEVVDDEGQPLTENSVVASPPRAAEGYIYNEVVELQAQAAPGWRFVGWRGDLESASARETLIINQDMRISAVFAKEYYTVMTRAVNVDGSLTDNNRIAYSPPADPRGYQFGEQVVFEAMPAPGYAFSNWQGGIGGTTAIVTTTISSSLEVTAFFQPLTYAVTVTPRGVSGSPVPADQVHIAPPRDPAGYRWGESVELRAIAEMPWLFLRWEGDVEASQATEATIFITIDGNKEISAIFDVQESGVKHLYLPIARSY